MSIAMLGFAGWARYSMNFAEPPAETLPVTLLRRQPHLCAIYVCGAMCRAMFKIFGSWPWFAHRVLLLHGYVAAAVAPMNVSPAGTQSH